MNLKRVTNAKLIVVLRKKKHVRYLICAKFVNRIGSALYNLALLTLAAKQTYSTTDRRRTLDAGRKSQ